MQRLRQFLNDFVPVESADIEIPLYSRAQIRSGIVHFGPGNFPLAHIVAKTHELMQSGDKDALNYGVVTVSIHSPDRRDQLVPQDYLYTIAEQDPFGKNKMTVVGAIVGAFFAPEDYGAVVQQLASPDTRIVSMTITPQAHQSYMNAQGNLNLANEEIAHDLNPAATPKTVLGFIARGIQQRKAQGLPGFTVMNLDNMEHNGKVLGKMVGQFATAFDAGLTAEIEEKYTFPNSMVDRIVPKTTQSLLHQVSVKTGFVDLSAVPAEPMPKIGSWVLEDNFAHGRPAWETLELVKIVPDVLPYEKMKLRILNVSHSFMANLGDLAGMAYIDQTMNNPAIKDGTLTLMSNETEPTLPEIPGINIEAYKAEVVSRFANPNVQDTTWRVAKDAPLQVVLDSARDQIAAGGSYELLALNVAAWMQRFRVETNEVGGKIDAVHPMVDILKAKSKEGGNDPRAMFSIAEIFGDIGTHGDFVVAVGNYMEMLEKLGVQETVICAIQASDAAVKRTVTPDCKPEASLPKKVL